MKPFLQRGSKAGFTLIEMIVVMGLLAMLFGIGVGMLSSLNPGKGHMRPCYATTASSTPLMNLTPP